MFVFLWERILTLTFLSFTYALFTFSERTVHPVAEFANAIGNSMPPVLDRVLDAFTSSRSGSYQSTPSHSSLPALGKRDRSWSSNLGERPSSASGGKRPAAASVGGLSRADTDELAKLIGDDGQKAIDGETKTVEVEQPTEGIVFDNDNNV